MNNPNAASFEALAARTYAARQPGAKPASPTPAPSAKAAQRKPAPSAKAAQRKPAPSSAAKSAAALQAIAQRRYGTAEPAYD